MNFLIIMASVFMCATSFRIPILFGNLDINRRPDGQVDVTVDQQADILGFGGGRNTTLTVGKDTFLVSDNSTILTNGTTSGGATKFGFNNGGIVADGNLNVGNKSVQSGLGKEKTFVKDLVGLFKS